MNQIKQFDTIYYNLYPKRLEEIGADANQLMITKLIPMHPIIDYDWTNESEFYEQYYIYIKDYFEYEKNTTENIGGV